MRIKKEISLLLRQSCLRSCCSYFHLHNHHCFAHYSVLLAVGEKNIERQKWKDFEVEDLFNTCRTLAYSSSPDVNQNLKTPLPTLALSEDGVPITPLLAAAAISRNVYNPYYSTTTAGYPYTSQSTSGGNCSPSFPEICIPPSPPVLNCDDISSRNFRIIGPDPHNFDGDNDGIGCEE